jgi:glycosyltransferase involved in cell wall biosynthesis
MSKPRLLLILPIYNEEQDLERSVRRLVHYAEHELGGYAWKVLVGDNASTDRSPEIYHRLQKEDPRVTFLRIEQKGRGRILKHIWLTQPYDVSMYMDLDLSTDLRHIKPCVDRLAEQGYDLAIGSRLRPGAKVTGRTPLREATSRGYVLITRLIAGSRLTDFQCGFKAIRQEAALRVLPAVLDTNWFFDTELLLTAEKAGLRIYEEPVHWEDDPGSTVHIGKTIREDLRGLLRVKRSQPWRSVPPAATPPATLTPPTGSKVV